MPEVSCTRSIAADRESIWEVVQDMDNWAPFVMGYQSHEVVDERHSVWTVKGELGALARTVRFEVDITEWAGPERVRFEIHGITETFDGDGVFLIGESGGGGTPSTARPARPRGWRSLPLLRWLFRSRRGDEVATAAPTSAGAGTTFSFSLRMQAGGMTGPVVNVMIEPLMRRAGEELADRLTELITSRSPG